METTTVIAIISFLILILIAKLIFKRKLVAQAKEHYPVLKELILKWHADPQRLNRYTTEAGIALSSLYSALAILKNQKYVREEKGNIYIDKELPTDL